MKPHHKLLFFCAWFLVAGCQKYETQFEGPYDDKTYDGTPPANFEIVYAQGNEIKIISNKFSAQKSLKIASGPVSLVSINYNHDKIAYKVPGENIEIIDTTGATIATVGNSKDVTWFDWHQNGSTLYMVDNFKIRFYGPTIYAKLTDLENVFPAGAQAKSIPSLAITPDGSVVVNYRWKKESPDYSSRLKVIKNTLPTTVYELNIPEGMPVTYIRLLKSGTSAFVGFDQSTHSVVNLLNVSNGSNIALANARMAAIEPFGINAALWAGERIYSVNDMERGVEVGTATVTSMDW